MPPKGYKKPKAVPYITPEDPAPAPIVSVELPPEPPREEIKPVEAPKRICKTCAAWVGCNDWGKCKFNPIVTDKFATDWCLRHQPRG